MEYISLQVTPTPDGGWKASPYIRATVPTRQGHPRVLHTFPEIRLTAVDGLEVGAVAGVLRASLDALGALPICGMCGQLLGDDLTDNR